MLRICRTPYLSLVTICYEAGHIYDPNIGVKCYCKLRLNGT